MIFQYTAVDSQGARHVDTIESADLRAARAELMQRGLMVVDLGQGERRRRAPVDVEVVAPDSAGGAAARPKVVFTARAKLSEVALFARQLGMMLQAGAAIVPSIRAMQNEAVRPAWKSILNDVATRVEGGAALHEALGIHRNAFSGMFRSIVRAGEANGQLATSCMQLSRLIDAQRRVRNRIVGSLAYPALLLLLACAVVTSMTLFILPRFAQLFDMLDAKLPLMTTVMLNTAETLKTWWPVALLTPTTVITLLVLWLRSDTGRATIERGIMFVPIVRKLAAALMLTQLLQLWSAALRSKVPLLEAIQQATELSRNVVMQELVQRAHDAVREGRSLSSALREFSFVPPAVLAAVATGEESGKLGEAMEFVGNWLDEDSSNLLATFTRLMEPMILVVMGVVVGTMALSLFLPLFDLATAA